MDAKFLKKKIKEELQEVQKYLDDGYWDYDDKTDEQLGYVNIKAEEFIARIEDWDFTATDNAVYHYTRLNLLENLLWEMEKKWTK